MVQPNTQPEEYSQEVRRSLLRLPLTENLEKEVVNAETDKEALLTRSKASGFINSREVERADERITRAKAELEKAPLRDAIQSTRPSDCWCVGTGLLKDYGRDYDTKGFKDGIRVGNWCPCDEGVAAATAYFEERDRKREERRLEKAEAQWDEIPARFYDYTLDSHPNKRLTSLVHKLATAEDGELSCLSLFLWGDYGVGKTGLAIGYAHDLLFGGQVYSVVFRRIPDLLTELRATYNNHKEDAPSESDVLEKYITAQLLVLDDLGAEHVNGSGWIEDRLYQIIGARHDDESITIFTSNLSPEALAAKIGERLMWRIVEMCGENGIIEVKGKNLRDFKAKK